MNRRAVFAVKTFLVEKNVPLARDGRGRPPGMFIATLRALKIGESFLVPRNHKDFVHAKRAAMTRFDGKFVRRATQEGVRYWRLK